MIHFSSTKWCVSATNELFLQDSCYSINGLPAACKTSRALRALLSPESLPRPPQLTRVLAEHALLNTQNEWNWPQSWISGFSAQIQGNCQSLENAVPTSRHILPPVRQPVPYWPQSDRGWRSWLSGGAQPGSPSKDSLYIVLEVSWKRSTSLLLILPQRAEARYVAKQGYNTPPPPCQELRLCS